MATGFKPGLGSAVWSPDLTPMSEPQYIGALVGLFILSIGFRALVAAQGYLEAYLHLHYYPRPHSSSSTSSSHSRRAVNDNSYQRSQLMSLGLAADEDDNDVDEESGHNSGLDRKGDTGVGMVTDEKNTHSSSQQQQGQGVQRQQSTQPSLPHHLPDASSSRPKRYGTHRHHSPPPPPFYAHQPQLPFLTFPTAQPFIWQAEVARALLTTAVVGIGYMLMLVIMTYNSAYLGVILAGVFVGEVYFARWGRVRPIFPSTPKAPRASRQVEIKQQQQQSQSSEGPGGVMATARVSTNSLTPSTASSHGYSTAMAHHGLSGDGSC
ncbi:hypothetical protein BGX33_012602 [Mortierella sp. NVP41]|nr:hypothetical protein BGX33_012602 [Mortierella sp. NVP41]